MQRTTTLLLSGTAPISWRIGLNAVKGFGPSEALLDLIYGSRPRNRIDIFRCGKAHSPLLVYIHGGYWQRNAKEFFACLAEGPLARGFDAALVAYRYPLVAHKRISVRHSRRKANCFRLVGWRPPNGHDTG